MCEERGRELNFHFLFPRLQQFMRLSKQRLPTDTFIASSANPKEYTFINHTYLRAGTPSSKLLKRNCTDGQLNLEQACSTKAMASQAKSVVTEAVVWLRHHSSISLLKPTGHVMHQQFNIPQLYALPALYLCVLYLSENKQRLVQLTA